MEINLIPDSSVSSAPTGFTAAVEAAANIFDQDFLGNFTVNITYGWGTYDNQTNSKLTTANNGISSIGGTENSATVSYATVKSWLTANATLSDQQAAVASLAANTSSFPGAANSFFVSSAQEKALGVYSGSSSTVDGSIGFNDTDPANSNFEGLALCEIAHALGWITDFYAGAPTIADLFRFGSQGPISGPAATPPTFRSTTGRRTSLISPPLSTTRCSRISPTIRFAFPSPRRR